MYSIYKSNYTHQFIYIYISILKQPKEIETERIETREENKDDEKKSPTEWARNEKENRNWKWSEE